MKKINLNYHLALAALAIIATGCGTTVAETSSPGGKSAVKASGKQGAFTLLAIDYSQSTESIRNQLMVTSFDIGTNFDPQVDQMRLYRFGHNVEEIWDSNDQSAADLDDDSFAMILSKNVKESDPVGGTNYALMLESIADAAENTPEPTVRVIIVGDGENDFKGNQTYDKRYKAAALKLAKNPKVTLVRLWGVNTGTREELRSVLRPLDRNLQVMSLDQNPLAP